MMKINSLTKKRIELRITSILQAIASNDLEEQKVDAINCDSQSANKIFASRRQLVAHEKEQLSAIQKEWPDGQNFINKFTKLIEAQEMMFDNLETMRYFAQTKLDTSKESSLLEARGLILKNREFMSRIRCLLDDANKILKNDTDLDMEILFG